MGSVDWPTSCLPRRDWGLYTTGEISWGDIVAFFLLYWYLCCNWDLNIKFFFVRGFERACDPCSEPLCLQAEVKSLPVFKSTSSILKKQKRICKHWNAWRIFRVYPRVLNVLLLLKRNKTRPNSPCCIMRDQAAIFMQSSGQMITTECFQQTTKAHWEKFTILYNLYWLWWRSLWPALSGVSSLR